MGTGGWRANRKGNYTPLLARLPQKCEGNLRSDVSQPTPQKSVVGGNCKRLFRSRLPGCIGAVHGTKIVGKSCPYANKGKSHNIKDSKKATVGWKRGMPTNYAYGAGLGAGADLTTTRHCSCFDGSRYTCCHVRGTYSFRCRTPSFQAGKLAA